MILQNLPPPDFYFRCRIHHLASNWSTSTSPKKARSDPFIGSTVTRRSLEGYETELEMQKMDLSFIGFWSSDDGENIPYPISLPQKGQNAPVVKSCGVQDA